MIDLMSWRRVTTLSKNDTTMEQGKELVKRKMKPRGGNSPVIGDNGVHTKPGDNAKYAGVLATILKWGPVDKSDVGALEKRFWDFVNYCMENDVKVTNQVTYLAMGISKDDVYHWENGLTRSSDVYKRQGPGGQGGAVRGAACKARSNYLSVAHR